MIITSYPESISTMYRCVWVMLFTSLKMNCCISHLLADFFDYFMTLFSTIAIKVSAV